MPENVLDKIQKLDEDRVNGIDLQEFEKGIKNWEEKDLQDLGEALNKKDKSVLALLDEPLNQSKIAYESGVTIDSKIITLLKLSGKIEIPKIEDVKYLENISILLGSDTQNIKNIVETRMKNINLIRFSQSTLNDMDIDENGVYIKWIDNGEEKNNYILPLSNIKSNTMARENKALLVNNVKSLVSQYLNTFSQYNRQKNPSLQGISENIRYEEGVIKCYKELLNKKDEFKSGTLDLVSYGTKYGKEQLAKAMKYVISQLVQDKYLTSAEDLYTGWDTTYTINKDLPKTFIYIEKNFKTQSSIYDAIYESLYFGFLHYEFKDYIDPTTKYLTKDISIQGKTTDSKGKPINWGLLNTTEYGKALWQESKSYYWGKEDEKINKENNILIKGFENRLSVLKTQMEDSESNYNHYKNTSNLWAWGADGSYPSEYYTWQANTEKSGEVYNESIKTYAVEGSKIFVKMLLSLDASNKKLLDPKLQGRVNALNTGTKVNSPIGTKTNSLDFSKFDANKSLDTNVDDIVRDSFREKTGDALQKMLDDIKNDPAKFFVDVVAIIGGGLAAGIVTALSDGAGIVAAGATFTAVSDLIKGVGYGTLEMTKGGQFSDGFGTGIGYMEKNEKGEFAYKNMSTFLTEKTFEFGSGIILMGPISKIGTIAEGYALNVVSQSVGVGEKILAKGVGLMTEAGVFTAFGTVYNPLQTAALTNQTYTQALQDAMQPDKLLSGFIYNIGFIGALKVGGFLSNPLSKKIMDKVTLKKYDDLVAEFGKKGDKLAGEMKNIGITTKEDAHSENGIIFCDKNGREITDFTSKEYAEISNIQGEMLAIQQQIVGLSARLVAFNQKPKVKEFNEFCDNNDLVSEFLPQDVIINKRIEYFRKKGNVGETAKRTALAKQFDLLKSSYDKELMDFKEESTPTPKPEELEIKRIRDLQDKPFDELTLQDWKDMGGLNQWKAYIQKNELWKNESLSIDREGKKNIDISKKQNLEDLTLNEFSKLIENIQAKKTKIEEGKTQPERIIEKPEEIKDDVTANPERLLALTEEEMKIVLEKEVNEIKEELKTINSQTTIEQKLAIIKKVEVFFNKIRDILSYIKDHYETVKGMKGMNRVDYMVNLVDELWLHEEIANPGVRQMVMPETHDLITIGLKGIVEVYKNIRVHYDNIKQLDKEGNSLGNKSAGEKNLIEKNKIGENNENIEQETKTDKNRIINNSEAGEKMNDFIEKYKTSDIVNYLGDLQKLYDDNLPNEVKTKVNDKGETLTDTEIFQIKQAYEIRFKTAVEYIAADGNMVKFRNSNGEWIRTNINEYGKSLLSPELYMTAEGQVFFNKIKKYMFYQTLDNPLQYCSHGFDHSILVDEYVKNISKSTDVINKTIEKYEISQDAAILLLRLTAVFHDFGYPEVGNLDKSTHGPFGGLLFKNEITESFESLFTKQLGVESTKINEITQDMADAIFFHSADKVEQGYLNKVKFTKGDFLIGENVASGIDSKKGTTEENITLSNVVVMMKAGEELTIYYREGNSMAKINAESFKQKLIDIGVDERHIKIEMDNKATNYDETHGIDMYQGRKSKSITDFGIEFKPIDLYTDPLSGVVRLADNFDMSLNRLSELQNGPVFMDMMYNFGMTKLGPNTSSTIFQSIEKIVKMDPSVSKTQTIETLKQQVITNGIEIMINDGNNGNIKDFKTVKLNETEINALFKADGNIDINVYKVYIVDQLAKIHNVKDVALLQGIKNVALEDKTGSYSFRHFVGLTPIKDVTLLKKNEKIYNNEKTDFVNKEVMVIKVTVDENIYNSSTLANQDVYEGTKKIRLNEYHIWRLYDASARVTVDNTLLQVEIYNQKGDKIGETSRTSANDEFKIKKL